MFLFYAVPNKILMAECKNWYSDINRNPLQWRHNERDGVSNHRGLDCLLNRLSRPRSNETSTLCVTGLCEGVHWWAVVSPHKGPVTRKMFPFDDVIIHRIYFATSSNSARAREAQICHQWWTTAFKSVLQTGVFAHVYGTIQYARSVYNEYHLSQHWA